MEAHGYHHASLIGDYSLTIEFVYEYNLERQIDEVYDAIVQWLGCSRGVVKSNIRPTDLTATQGSHRVVSGWKAGAKKNIHFVLERTERGTHVRVTVSPVSLNEVDVGKMQDQARINWALMLEDIWRDLGDTHSESRSLDLVTESEVIKELDRQRANAMMKIGGLGSAISLLVVVVSALVTRDWYEVLADNLLLEIVVLSFLYIVFAGFLSVLVWGVVLRSLNRRK
jgi:hypothetical protein